MKHYSVECHICANRTYFPESALKTISKAEFDEAMKNYKEWRKMISRRRKDMEKAVSLRSV